MRDLVAYILAIAAGMDAAAIVVADLAHSVDRPSASTPISISSPSCRPGWGPPERRNRMLCQRRRCMTAPGNPPISNENEIGYADCEKSTATAFPAASPGSRQVRHCRLWTRWTDGVLRGAPSICSELEFGPGDTDRERVIDGDRTRIGG